MLGEMLGFGGGLVGAGLNYLGAREANKANQKMAREQMQFQQGSNREQMAFQERMSNTSYQRSMEDMKKAGLNPILAFNQGGASTPGGASSGGSTAQMSNEFSGAVSSALQAKQIAAGVDQTKAMTKILEADLSQKRVEAEIFDSKFGKLLKVMQMLTGPINSAGGLFSKFLK